MDAGGENRGFEDCVLGAVETEEVAIAALVNRLSSDLSALLRNNVGSLLRMVERVHFESVPTAGIGEDEAVERGQGGGLPEGSLGEKQYVVSNVKDAEARAFEIFVGRRRAVGAEDVLRDSGIDDRPHRRDVDGAIFVMSGDDAFEDAAVGAKLWKIVGHRAKR